MSPRMTALLLAAFAALVPACSREPDPPMAPAASGPAMARPSGLSASQRANILRIHFKGEAAFVDFSLIDPSGNEVFGQVSTGVNQEPGQAATTTSLFYFVFICDEGVCEEAAVGGGTIPNADLKGNARQGLVLDTDTTGNPDFEVLVGDRGPIHIEWTPNDAFTTQTHFSLHSRGESFAVKTNEMGTNTSATAEGNLLDFLFEATFAEMGTTKTRVLEVIH